jgi:hypothetical protein
LKNSFDLSGLEAISLPPAEDEEEEDEEVS